MKSCFHALAFLGALLTLSMPAHAVPILSLTPSSPSVSVGEGFTVDLSIFGSSLDFPPHTLGAFLVEVTFDEAVLDFDSVTYSPVSTLPFETTVSPGVVSLDLILFLDALPLQPGAFTLATLSFTGEAVGSSALDFGLVDLLVLDGDGSSEASTVTVPGSVSVTHAVPAPATSVLVLLGWALARRRRKSIS